MISQPSRGQRWVSDSEPELGLGIVSEYADGMVSVRFRAAAELRRYALESAPLRRVEFKPGDRLQLKDGTSIVVERVEQRKALLLYHGEGREVFEMELSDAISFSKPEDRLLAGVTDEIETFNLRLEAMYRRSQLRQSPVRGFAGGRVDLLPHQLFIASEVAGRMRPRVLLADEVGLGKTIEAGLILHRLHLTGRAERVLILLPEPLIHQWFVEMLRRFNLLFSLFDEERCEQIQLHHEHLNPFLENQLIICSTDFLANDPVRSQQALEAGWDLLIVDEAHHLEWHPAEASPQYEVVEALAKSVPGLLLLTATPQQLGPEGHFARLRLLDPERHGDLAKFQQESENYELVARTVDRLSAGKTLTTQDQQLFARASEAVRQAWKNLDEGNESARPILTAALLDEFGIGRVMFRNTRNNLSGFPVREACLVPLESAPEADGMETKVKWIASLLRNVEVEKVLLICRTRELAEEIQTRLRGEIQVNTGLFHEGLTLLQRDRQAAYFAEEDGARILLCSEIGSEGRNFQFAHHLILFDLPLNAELLEQRIGRLDRIGQKETIRIHVPYLSGTKEEALARWFHEGLNAFEKTVRGASQIANEVGLGNLAELELDGLTSLIKTTHAVKDRIGKQLARGHDRLLELGSSHREVSESLIQKIRKLDDDPHFEAFFIRVLDHFGMTIEERGPRTYVLHAGNLLTNSLPSLPPEGLTATFDRTQALAREDWAFLTLDHPLVRGALDLLLGGEMGNAAFAVWKDSGADGVMIEAIYAAECVAPPALHVDRFFPASPVRIVIDHLLQDHSQDREYIRALLQPGELLEFLEAGPIKTILLPKMLDHAREMAAEKAQSLAQKAAAVMDRKLAAEIMRLKDLKMRNDHVSPEEITALEKRKEDLANVISQPIVRLDAVRLVLRKR